MDFCHFPGVYSLAGQYSSVLKHTGEINSADIGTLKSGWNSIHKHLKLHHTDMVAAPTAPKQKKEHLNRVILSWSPPHGAICQPRWLLTILESWFRSWQPCGLSCRPSWGISYRQTPCPSVCPSPGTARRIPSYAKESEEEKKDGHREKEKQTAKRWIWETNME